MLLDEFNKKSILNSYLYINNHYILYVLTVWLISKLFHTNYNHISIPKKSFQIASLLIKKDQPTQLKSQTNSLLWLTSNRSRKHPIDPQKGQPANPIHRHLKLTTPSLIKKQIQYHLSPIFEINRELVTSTGMPTIALK